jgi:hypothetical protein
MITKTKSRRKQRQQRQQPQQVSFSGSPEFTITNYQPRQHLEKVVAYGLKYLSNHNYFPEVVVGEKANGKSYRVDGVLPDISHLVSVREQTVSGSTDDKLLTEIQSLQDACDVYGWKKAILVINDPNENMSWGKAFLSKNQLSACYVRNKERYPDVEVMEFGDFASRFFNKIDHDKVSD